MLQGPADLLRLPPTQSAGTGALRTEGWTGGSLALVPSWSQRPSLGGLAQLSLVLPEAPSPCPPL